MKVANLAVQGGIELDLASYSAGSQSGQDHYKFFIALLANVGAIDGPDDFFNFLPEDWQKIKSCVRNIYVLSTIFVLRCVIVKCVVS